jgi:hypothetical protein
MFRWDLPCKISENPSVVVLLEYLLPGPDKNIGKIKPTKIFLIYREKQANGLKKIPDKNR